MTPTPRLLLAPALTLPLAGCFDKGPEQLVEAAWQALQKSDSKTAIVELTSALQKVPGNAKAPGTTALAGFRKLARAC